MTFLRSTSDSKVRSPKNHWVFLRRGLLFFLLFCICNISFFPPIKQCNQVVFDKSGIKLDKDYSLLEVILEDVFGFDETDNEPEDDIKDLVKKIEYLFPVKTTISKVNINKSERKITDFHFLLVDTILEKYTPPPKKSSLLS